MKKNFKRFISIFLSIAIMTTIIPFSVYASEETVIDETEQFVAENAEIEYEVESLRTENSKTYVTADGGYYQLTSLMPIHQETEDQFEEIANISENIVTVEDATSYVSALAEASAEDSYANTGLYEDEALTMTGYPNATEYCVSGSRISDIENVIYIRPSIISDRSVFIYSAKLELGIDYCGSKDNAIDMYELTEPIVPSKELQYNSDLLYDSIDIDESETAVADITSYCHYCSLGKTPNYGIALTPYGSRTEVEISSIVLGIYYRELGDVDNGIESETVDMDRAGTVYINNYSCSPVLVRDDFSIYSELAQVNIQTVINPSAIDDNVSDGIGTRTNYYSTIQYGTNEYHWKSCNGDNIYFTNTTGNTYEGIDSSGEKYILTREDGADVYAYNKISVTKESDGTVYRFGKHTSTGSELGYLANITDDYGNKIVISYSNGSSVGNEIQTITDGNNHTYKYNYTTLSNGTKQLSSINVCYLTENEETLEEELVNVKVNGEDIAINYFYDDNGRMNKVVYPDGYTIVYTYDDNGRILSITNYNNSNLSNKLKSIEFEYETSIANSKMISSYIVRNKNTVIEDIEYLNTGGILTRTIKDKTTSEEINKILKYDYSGNLIYYKDFSGTEYSLNYIDGELQKIILPEDTANNYVVNGNFEEEIDDEWTLSSTNKMGTDSGDLFNNGEERTYLYMDKQDTVSWAEQKISSDDFTEGTSFIFSSDASSDLLAPIVGDKDFSAIVYYIDENDNKIVIGNLKFDYTVINNWQTQTTYFKLPETVDSLYVKLTYNYLPGTGYFTGVKLYPATAENVIDVSDGSLTNEYTLNYNNNGTIASETKSSTLGKTMGTYYDYDSNNYISAITNDGRKTYYKYDASNGMLMSKGNNSQSSDNAQFAYNGIGALTQVKQAITNSEGDVSELNTSYTYEDDRIKTITHNGCTYEYEYTPYGKVSKIQVLDGDNLDYGVEYAYLDKDHLGSIQYANGNTVVYTYSGDNIEKIAYYNGSVDADNLLYEYNYEYKNGKVVKYSDSANGTVTTYSENGYTITRNGETLYSNESNNEVLFGQSYTIVSDSDTDEYTNITTGTTNYTFTDKIPDVDENGDFTGTYHTETSEVETITLNDSLGRTTGSSLTVKDNFKVNNVVTYVDTDSDKTTNLIESYSSSVSKNRSSIIPSYTDTRILRVTSYEYNDTGMITDIYRNSQNKIPYSTENDITAKVKIHHYEYDEAGQISLEVDTINNKAIKYTYDNGGNITSKKIYTDGAFSYNDATNEISFVESKAQETVMTYKTSGMTDYLASYNGTAISYDQAGNPMNYVGTNGFNTGEISGTFTWEGKRLKAFDSEEYNTTYQYDGDGRRTLKTRYDKENSLDYPTQTTEYIWEEDTLIGYHIIVNTFDEGTPSVIVDRTVRLIYNNNNELMGLKVVACEGPQYISENVYSFLRDGQGNITDLYDSSETLVCSFTYDAYGNVTPQMSGQAVKDFYDNIDSIDNVWVKIIAMFFLMIGLAGYTNGALVSSEEAYRGYIYDIETGLYCTQNRYYSPAWGRFINADDPATLQDNIGEVHGANLFTYCNNDPINEIDPTGCDSISYTAHMNILELLGIKDIDMTNIGMSTGKFIGEISNRLDILGFRLSTNTNVENKKYWNRILGNIDNTVFQSHGTNYIDNVIVKNQSGVTSYSVKKKNTPYRTYYSVDQ